MIHIILVQCQPLIWSYFRSAVPTKVGFHVLMHQAPIIDFPIFIFSLSKSTWVYILIVWRLQWSFASLAPGARPSEPSNNIPVALWLGTRHPMKIYGVNLHGLRCWNWSYLCFWCEHRSSIESAIVYSFASLPMGPGATWQGSLSWKSFFITERI